MFLLALSLIAFLLFITGAALVAASEQQ